jgi:hypothetical protein
MHRTPDPAIGAIFTHTARLVALFATTRHPTPTAIGVGQTLVALRVFPARFRFAFRVLPTGTFRLVHEDFFHVGRGFKRRKSGAFLHIPFWDRPIGCAFQTQPRIRAPTTLRFRDASTAGLCGRGGVAHSPKKKRQSFQGLACEGILGTFAALYLGCGGHGRARARLTVALFHFVCRWALVMAQVTARVGLKINRTVPENQSNRKKR